MAFKIKEVILGISITILFVLFVVFGIRAFYKEPKYDDFCNSTMFIERAYPYPIKEPYREINQSLCYKIEVKNYDFEQDCYGKKGQVIYAPDENGCRVAKECNFCNKNFDDVRNIYNKYVFIVSGIVGIIAVIIGAILHLPSVSTGLFGGGVITIIYGTIRYWSELADWARFIIIGIALGVLIYLGYKKFRNQDDNTNVKKKR